MSNVVMLFPARLQLSAASAATTNAAAATAEAAKATAKAAPPKAAAKPVAAQICKMIGTPPSHPKQEHTFAK